MGTPNSLETFCNIFKAFSSPIPEKLSIRERFAFLNDPLKTYGISNLSVTLTSFSAMRRAISSPSIAQGPANKKKLPLVVCLICGMFCKFICVVFEVAKIKIKTF